MLYTVVGLIIYIDEEDIMSWFNKASDGDEISRDKVGVSRKSATSVDVSFSSGKFVAASLWHIHHCYIQMALHDT